MNKQITEEQINDVCDGGLEFNSLLDCRCKEFEDFIKDVENAKGFSGFVKIQRKAQKLLGKKVE